MSIFPAKISINIVLMSFAFFNQLHILSQETSYKEYQATDKNQLLRKSFVPAFLLAGGMSTWNYRKDFRDLRNKHLPGFRYHFDDYLQYAPAALVFSLKAVGVRGKYN